MMKKLFTILLLFVAAKSFSTTFYVSTLGNNANAGTSIGAAWLTHVYAFAHAASGDSIVTVQGTYNESGQLTLPTGISWHGLDSSACIIKSTLTTYQMEMVNMRSAENTNGNQTISGLKFDGQSATFSFFRVGGRRNVSIHDCSFVNAKIYGVTFAEHNTDDNDPGYPAVYAVGNSFYNNKMWNCGNWDTGNGNGFGALQFGGQSGMLIYNNTIIQNNTCGNNGWPIKYWQGGYDIGCKIYNNYLQAAPQCYTLGDLNWDFAIEIFNMTGLEIYNNTLVNGCVDFNNSSTTGFNTGGSFLVGGYGYSLWVHDNAFSMTVVNTHVQTGITLEFNVDSVIIKNNTFDKFNIGVLTTPRTGNTQSNIGIYNNLFTDLAEGDGSEGYGIDFGVYSGSNLQFKNFHIVNNTFLAYATTPIKTLFMLPNSTGSGTLDSIQIKNTIVKGCYQAPFATREGTVAITHLDIQYNSIFGCGNSNLPSYTISPTTGYIFSNNVNVNPSFGANFKLITGTPLVNAGVNLGYGTSINYTDSTAPAPPVVCNSFNADAIGPTMSLINNNLTVRKGQFADATAKTTASTSSGKVCWEMTVDSITAGQLYDVYIGITNAAAPLNIFPGIDVNGWTMRQDGTLFHNGFYSTADTVSFKQGTRMLFTLDNTLGILNFYKRVGGSWVQYPQTFTGLPAVAFYPSVGADDRGFKATINLSPTDTIVGFRPICISGAIVNPTANAGTDQTITLPTSSTMLLGSGTAGSSSIAFVTWRQLTGTSSTISNTAIYTPTITGLSTAGVRTYELAVTATDGGVGKDTVQVTVNAAPLVPPTANAGSDQTITLPTSQVTMAGMATAGTYAITSTVWSQYSGTTATITNSASPTTSITGLATAGVRGFVFTVTDNHSNVSKDSMTVTVNAPSTPPVVSSVFPMDGSVNNSVNVHLFGIFNAPLASGTVNTTNVTLTENGNAIPISVSLNSNVINITPLSALSNSKTYTVVFKTGITDTNGLALAQQYTYSFTTVASGLCPSCVIVNYIIVGN